MPKRGQTWSMELIISLSVFIVIIVGVFISMSAKPENQVQQLQQEGQQFIGRFYSTDSTNQQSFAFIDGNNINNQKLALMQGTPYTTLKSELGVQDDFCVVIIDSNNNIVPVTGPDGKNYYGIGSGKIQIANGIPCNSTVS